MKIVTGKGEISLVAMIGIWSVSALTSLPGLAISPIMGQLTQIFPHATDLEIQMLTSLPSLLIIPFILLSGKLAECIGYSKVLYFGLAMFFISGVLYFFSNNIVELILVSGLLGIGAGIIIPLSTALISHFFVGNYRTKQFGYISAITNLTLVIATALTGYLAGINWRLPFIVYLLPIISLLMVSQIFKEDKNRETKRDKWNKKKTCSSSNNRSFQDIKLKSLLSNMWYYFLITYTVLIISLNLPFLLEEYGYHSSNAGILISLFFLAIMLPGFFINTIRELIGQTARFVSLIIMAAAEIWKAKPWHMEQSLSFLIVALLHLMVTVRSLSGW